ncbi:MAG: 30S ribosomal protein S12 methylthiotransferase RimO [Oscillospiraceae bacterium]|jgi:ribosomal protein S12 methylthiotransferase|nr:30S ribosomal protein S12 methylthiotransferase RimO [Oscillospiraceae bacterium]
MTSYKVAMVSLGCAKNLVNSEQMMFLLSEAGFDVTGLADCADAVVINTCGFIESAKMEAIETIIEFGQKKKEGLVGKIIVAGCLPERYKHEIMWEMPEIDAIVGVGSFDDIVSAVKSALEGKQKPMLFGRIDSPVSETGRILSSSKVWTYLKIAEGCDNRCAFCAIPDIRGRFRSRPIENVIKEANGLAGRGIKEIIIVAQDVTRYGLDLYGRRRLTELLAGLCDIEGLRWIRLHYLYPDEIDDGLIDFIAGNEKVLNYLDIPIQHINDSILRNMRRRGTGGEIRSLIRRLRERIQGVVIRTSIIAGLPGEGEQEFDELCEFLADAKIERAGVFQYSPEEGTAAALMDMPDPDIAARRAELITDIQLRVMDEFNKSRIGSVTPILVEGRENGHCYGRSFAESPEIDGYITILGDALEDDCFIDARITGLEEGVPV